MIWALSQLDDGLLADDWALEAEGQALAVYLSLPRSAPSKLLLHGLTSVGAGWYGSAFCARYIQRQLADATEVPAFWTREQSGEEAVGWLFFRHKIEYLVAQTRFVSPQRPPRRVFCLPEAAVSQTDRHERILLLLTVALMERYGIRVQVTARPEHADLDGIALVPGRRAVLATWVRARGEALWTAGVTSSRTDLRGYAEAFGDADAADLLAGPDPESRLRTLAGYLEIDWTWLTRRCRVLGESGVSGLIRPRSRLLTTDALDDVLAFVGGLAQDP